MSETRQLTVAKITEQELTSVKEYLIEIEGILEECGLYDEESLWEETKNSDNKKIANVVRKYPSRAWLTMLNLGILLDNYQDKESTILEHPKWIKEMISLFEEMNEYLSENKKNYIGSGSKLHNKIKKILKED